LRNSDDFEPADTKRIAVALGCPVGDVNADLESALESVRVELERVVAVAA
jgi:DNA-directed RNA polymerase specialized sigma24 family protein